MEKIHNSKELSCTVCGNSSAFERSFSNIRIYRYPDCDHCFSKLVDGDFEKYDSEYFEVLHKNWFNNPHIDLFETIYRVIADYKIDASVIDMGCGKGDLLRYIHMKNPALSLSGLDLFHNSPVEGIKFLQGDIFSIDPNQQYDVVVSTFVIENVFNVQMMIKKYSSLCAPDGLVIIITTNDRCILNATARLLYKFGYKKPLERIYSRQHLNHFNISSIKRLIENNGLLIKKIFFHNIPFKACDIPAQSRITYFILLAGVWGSFTIGKLLNRTFMLTFVCGKKAHI